MKKIKITTFLAIASVMILVLYLSFDFYKQSSNRISIVVSDTLNIDSIKSNYQSRVQKLEDSLSDKDVVIGQKTNELFSLKKNYDSVNAKLWYYKSKAKANTTK